MKSDVFTVSGLIRQVNQLLGEAFGRIAVEGEVSNFSRSGRGHLYFSLKDEQMLVSAIEPQGIGALQLAFEQLKARLEAEGLFEESRKKALPTLPLRVGIVTSRSAAALRDMLKILRRSHPVDVLLAPAAVQGDGAGREIASALDMLVERGDRDLIILGRGGGSMEDLWAFNTEPVARAISRCPVPVISGVGHETDFTISDFTADIRAATPTHAAEIVVSAIDGSVRRSEDAGRQLLRAFERKLEHSRARMKALLSSAGLARLPERLRRLRLRLESARRLPVLLKFKARRSRERMENATRQLQLFPGRVLARGELRLVESLLDRMVSRFRARLLHAGELLHARERALDHLSPRRILERGYSITTIEGDKKPLKDPAALRRGTILNTRLAGGSVRSLVAGHLPAKATKKRKQPSPTARLFDDGGPSDD